MSGLIFVVDADPSSNGSVAKTLTNAGYSVASFVDPNECLDAIETNTPDLIVSEVNLPELTGFEFCSSVRDQVNTPIVFLSSLNDAQNIKQAFEVGCADYLTKPCGSDQMLASVKASLASARHDAEKEEMYEDGTVSVHLDEGVRIRRISNLLDRCTMGRSAQEMAKSFFDILRPMGLVCSLLIRSENSTAYFSDDEADSAIEKKFLERVWADYDEELAASGRILRVNGQLVLGFKHLTLLVKNYNEQQHAGYIDFLASFLKSTELVAFADAKQRQQSALKLQESDYLMKQVEACIENMRTRLSSCETRMMNVMTLLVNEMCIELDALDLPPGDGDIIRDLVQDVMEDLVQVFTDSKHIDRPLREVLSDLQAFLRTTFYVGPVNQ